MALCDYIHSPATIITKAWKEPTTWVSALLVLFVVRYLPDIDKLVHNTLGSDKMPDTVINGITLTLPILIAFYKEKKNRE